MRTLISRLLLGCALTSGAALVACTANVHDNTINIPNAKVEMNTTIDAENVKPGQAVPVTVKVENVYLIDPGSTPPPEHQQDAGHLEIYFDTTDGKALMVTASVNFTVTVPPDTKDGDHKIICRVHKHDGTPTSSTFELKIKVKATVIT